MANLMRNRWLLLASLGAVLLFGLAAGKRLPGPTMVHAAGAGSVSFTPASGAAGDARLVSFSGFAAGETIDLVFFDPTNAAALVGGGGTFYASAQDDGTGVFNFVPSDWLTPLYSGTWTVLVTGETSLTVVKVTFSIT